MAEPNLISDPSTARAGVRGVAGSEAVEDYAKAIYALGAREGWPVSTSAIAERLEISPGSVTAMVKRMGELGLLEHQPYRGVTLTDAGERVALEVIRHHRLIESYLAEALGMSWDRVHDEAEVLEHYISEELEELIACALGDPSHDPHGDPIPGRDLRLESVEGDVRSLGDLEPPATAEFTRVSDSDPAMLRYLAERGIRPGIRLEVVERQPFGGPQFVSVGGERHAIGGELARRMLVRVDGVGEAR
ncbi:metal-dependent transcriptional regulator [Thermoleophilia bacterium SCSIO 60948]|nr:metal-dependent transcriptional regulator [Thermoleophilia bacterium SCSIO 60948]